MLCNKLLFRQQQKAGFIAIQLIMLKQSGVTERNIAEAKAVPESDSDLLLHEVALKFEV